MKLQSAAELKTELEEAVIANFQISPRFGLSSPEKRRAFAERSGLLPPLLVSFLDFQQKWETALQAPLSLAFPFRIEVSDITVLFNANKAQANEWLFPFARTDGGFVLAFWTWGLSWLMAPIVFLDENWHEKPHIVADNLTNFFLQTARGFNSEGARAYNETHRDFINWTQQHIRILELPPTADITQWDAPVLPDFAQWCKQMMR